MVAVKMGGPMPPMPMGGMQQPLNPLPTPMPVPPINPNMQFGQQPVGALPAAAGTAPVAPIMRSNAGRRKRFGDSLEGMLATTRPPPVASDQMAGMNVFTGQMPVRRMMGGGSVPLPRQTDIYGQDHMLAYIRPDEADLLMGLGGAGTPGPGGVPQFGFFDFISDVFSGGKSSNTGSGRNNPRGTSSSSPSYASPSNDPYAEDRPSISQSSADAGREYAESMIAGGGGTNLSGSGSTAMEKLVAAQQAQTQKDDGPPPDITGSFSSPPSVVSQQQDAMDFINQQFYKQQEEQRKNDEIRAAREAEAAALAAQEASFTQPSTQVNTGVIGGYDPIGGGSSDDPFYTPPPAITIDDTPPSDITGSFPSLGTGGGDDDSGVNLDPVFYDMFGNPYKTQAAAQAADAEHLRKQQEAAAAESQRLALEEEAKRKQIAAEANMVLDPFGGTGGPDDPLYVSDVFETPPPDLTDPRGDEANTMTNYLSAAPITDPINTGLGDKSLDKKVTDSTEDTDDRNFIQKFIDDIKDVPKNILNDLQMGIAAGFYGNDYGKARANLEKVLNADGTRKYSDKQIDDWIAATKETKKNQKDQRERDSARDDDGGSKTIVDPCPEGFKLDPASGICVPDTGTDTGGDDTDEDSGDDKEEDTSDDELSGVVVTPPPPTSYLDNPISIGRDRPIMMNRGGSVGLNRAADNFLAAMGA